MKKVTYTSFLSRVIILFMAFLMAIFPNTAVLAYDELFYSSNEILYYDPAGGCVSPGASYTTSADLPTLVGNDNAEKIWNFLKDEGFSDDQAAGIMGNIRQESNYEPDLEEGEGSYSLHTVRPVGYGLIQWTGQRRTDLNNFASDKGLQPSDLSLQLMFLKHEASNNPLVNFKNLFSNFNVSEKDNTWDSLKEIDGIDQTTKFFHDSFERSGDYENYGGIQNRIDYANQAISSFSGGGSSGGGGGGGSTAFGGSSCAPFAGGDLIQTLLAYAHPEYHPGTTAPVDPAPKQAYQDAANGLVADGKWVGGGAMAGDPLQAGYPGIDCGGFVSLLLTQSGFEPDYNYGLEPGRGASNQDGRGGEDPGGGQLGWAQRNWSFIGYGNEISTLDLLPGDVAYSTGHTFIFVGEVDGFDSQFASASYASSSGEGWRSPMSAGEFESATSPNYVWYGRRPENGSPPANGATSISDPIPSGNNIFPGVSISGRDW